MRLILSIILSSVSIVLFGQNSLTVKGTFPNDNYKGQSVYLNEFDDSFKYVVLDSCVVSDNRTFELKTKLTDNKPKVGLVMVPKIDPEIQPMSFIVIEQGTIKMTLGEDSKISGTAGNDEFQKFFTAQNDIIRQLYELRESGTPDNTKYLSLMSDLRKSLYTYVDKNIDNRVGEFFLVEASGLLDATQFTELLDKTRKEFSNKKEIKQLKNKLLAKTPSIGDQYLDISMNNPEGQEISLSDYVGKNKVVLIDFWASWCGPCRKEMPTVVEAYEKYKSKGFEIVGISLDESQLSWEKSIKAMNMTWPQMSDLGGWNSEAAQLYKVTSIPATFLVDQDGKVIAKNLRGEQLLQQLESLLNN